MTEKLLQRKLASSSSSNTRWGKCKPTFATELGSCEWAVKESKIPDLAANPFSNANCFLLCMNRATKEFEHFVVKHCLTKFFSWRLGWQLFTETQTFHLYNRWRLLFIHVTSAVRATAWLTVLDVTQPTVFDKDIDTSVRVWNRLKMFCFADLSAFFTSWSNTNIHIHCKTRKIFYQLPKFYLQKNPDLKVFFIIKPRHCNVFFVPLRSQNRGALDLTFSGLLWVRES